MMVRCPLTGDVGYTPHSLFDASKRERAVHGPREKTLCGQKFPLSGEIWPKRGGRANYNGVNLPGLIRLRWTLEIFQRLSRICGVDVDFMVLIARASATAPLPLRGQSFCAGAMRRAGAARPTVVFHLVGADAYIGPQHQGKEGDTGRCGTKASVAAAGLLRKPLRKEPRISTRAANAA